jgi:hypothetical protein
MATARSLPFMLLVYRSRPHEGEALLQEVGAIGECEGARLDERPRSAGPGSAPSTSPFRIRRRPSLRT